MEKIECAVVQDLLPLYNDEVVSERTAEIVGEHLKECENCSAELEKIKTPISSEEEKIDTKEKFRRFMKKHRIKQFAIGTLAVAAAVLAFAFMLTIPVAKIPAKDIEVVKAFRYENKQGEKKFFILYKYPEYNSSVGVSTTYPEFITGTGTDRILELHHTVPIIPGFKTGVREEVITPDAEGIYGDITAVKFGGEVIWTEEENADDPVPEYVYYYDEIMWSGSWTWIIDFDLNIIGGSKGNCEPQYWTIDGAKREYKE